VYTVVLLTRSNLYRRHIVWLVWDSPVGRDGRDRRDGWDSREFPIPTAESQMFSSFSLLNMLNQPLSLLSDDLLVYIVEQLAKLPFSYGYLKNLSLADRAFTESCQKYIFRELKLGDRKWSSIFEDLTKVKKFLEDKPLLAKRVRVVQINITSISSLENESSRFCKDPNFTGILQLLAKSPVLPHELYFVGGPFVIIRLMEDPTMLVTRLAESFFSQTLTILCFKKIANVPLPLFLICPRLREVFLDQVGATDN
jgi:hypothetical protein